MGPGDIKQKIDERGAKSNLPSARLAGWRLGDGRQSGRHELVLSGPRARCFLPNSGSWTAGLGRNRDSSPTLRSPRTRQHFGRNFGSFTHAPAPGGAGTEHPSLTRSEVPGPPHGDPDVPLAPARLPNSGGGALISAELPAPTAWSPRLGPTGRHRLPSPHREQVTTRAAPGMAAPRRFAGPSARSPPPAARLPRGALGASWHRPRRAAPLKAPPALLAFVRAAVKVMRGGGGGSGQAPRGAPSPHPHLPPGQNSEAANPRPGLR